MDTNFSNNPIYNNKKTKLVLVISFVVIIAVIGGIFWYRSYQAGVNEAQMQKQIGDIAQAASKVNLSNVERAKLVQDLANSGTVKLSQDEATKREAEIIKQLNSR